MHFESSDVRSGELSARVALQVESRGFRDLTDDELVLWEQIQRAHSVYASPLFSPAFAQAVACVRDDIEVAILSMDDNIVGFFPFHRNQKNIGTPMADLASDLHGPVIHPHLDWDPLAVIRSLELRSWQFDHLLASQRPFVDFHSATDACPVVDLTDGFDAYREKLLSRGSKVVAQVERKARKFAREVGPLRFQLHDIDPQVLQTFIDWKQDRVRAQGLNDVFRSRWVVELIQQLQRHEADGCSGLFSVLYAGSTPVAAHLGMASQTVLNSWIPAHDDAYRKYSPGLILQLYLAREASQIGIERIDLGRGMNPLKERLMTDSFQLALGSVDVDLHRRALKHCWYLTRRIVYATPLGKGPLRLFRKLRNGTLANDVNKT